MEIEQRTSSMGCVGVEKRDLQENAKTYWMADGKQVELPMAVYGYVKERALDRRVSV